MPEGLDCVYFTSSGSEAVVMATNFSRSYTGNYPLMIFKNGYHGHAGAQHMNSVPFYGHKAFPRTQGVEFTTFPDMYRCPFKPEEAVDRYVENLAESIEFCTAGKVGMLAAEPIMSAGGVHPLPEGFMPKVSKLIKEAGGLILADEVQTGFGRTGYYWGSELNGYKPDLVTMGK